MVQPTSNVHLSHAPALLLPATTGIPTFFAVMGLAGYLKVCGGRGHGGKAGTGQDLRDRTNRPHAAAFPTLHLLHYSLHTSLLPPPTASSASQYWNSPATVVITAVLMAAAFVYTVRGQRPRGRSIGNGAAAVGMEQRHRSSDGTLTVRLLRVIPHNMSLSASGPWPVLSGGYDCRLGQVASGPPHSRRRRHPGLAGACLCEKHLPCLRPRVCCVHVLESAHKQCVCWCVRRVGLSGHVMACQPARAHAGLAGICRAAGSARLSFPSHKHARPHTQGAWWSALEPSQRLPFAFHQVPHKDVCWPPPSSAAAAAASVASTAGDEHDRPRAGGSAAAATTAAPYLAHALAELPYPAIIGLQPWPTELALGVVPTMSGAHAGAHVGVVAGEAAGIAPPAPAAGAEQRSAVTGTQRWRQHSAVPREGPMEAGQRAVAGAAAAAAAAGAVGAAGCDGHLVAAGAELRPWPGGHVGGTSCSGGRVGVSADEGTAAQWAGENHAYDSADTEDVAAELALRPGTSAIAVWPVPDPALLPAGEQRLQLPPPPASVCLHRAPCGDAACSEHGASTAGPSGTTAPQAARKGVQGLMRALGSACGGASVAGGSGSAGGGTGPGSGSGAGGEGGAPGSRPAANGMAGVVDDGSLQVARPHPLQPVAECGSEDAFEAAAPWYAEDTASARVTTASLRSCESMLEDGSDEDGRGAST